MFKWITEVQKTHLDQKAYELLLQVSCSTLVEQILCTIFEQYKALQKVGDMSSVIIICKKKNKAAYEQIISLFSFSHTILY